MKLMIVENNKVLMRVWERYFSKVYDVSLAFSASEALQALRDSLPDCLVLDLRLNGITHSGMDVFNYIREEVKSNIPIIIITGLDPIVPLYMEAERVTAEDNAAGLPTTFLEKPVRIKKLHSDIEGVLDQHKRSRKAVA